MPASRRRDATVRRLEQASGTLAGAAIEQMEATLPWYAAMPADNRSWVGLVAQAGVAAFTEWFRHPDDAPSVTGDVFGTAPRALARTVSLQQTVDLVRTTIAVVEERVDALAAPGEEAELREAVLRYSREIAFAAAQVYAQAAEARGAWDARLEALVVDSVLRGEADEALGSRAAALGWRPTRSVAVLVGGAPARDPEEAVQGLHRAARAARLDLLTGVHGGRLVAVLGGLADAPRTATALLGHFGPGPVVLGPVVDDLTQATRSAREALAGLRAAPAWPGAPRPVLAEALLPERALDGDQLARQRLVEEVYIPLRDAGGGLLTTLAAYLEQAPSLEAAARLLFVHANTVRYRLRRVAELTGYSPTDARDAFALQLTLGLGRLSAPSSGL